MDLGFIYRNFFLLIFRSGKELRLYRVWPMFFATLLPGLYDIPHVPPAEHHFSFACMKRRILCTNKNEFVWLAVVYDAACL